MALSKDLCIDISRDISRDVAGQVGAAAEAGSAGPPEFLTTEGGATLLTEDSSGLQTEGT